MRADAHLFAVLAVHLVLTAAPGVAAALYAARRGVRDVPLLLGIALAASGLAAFGAFWAYFASPTIGQAWGFLVLLGSVQLIAWSTYRGGIDRDVLRGLLTPLLLWTLGSVFIVFLGFLHGGMDNAITMSASRFSSMLPSDNDIPRFFSEWFADRGHQGTPPLYPGDWLMSDRPPLQVGYVLSQRPFANDTAFLRYEVVCVVVQQLWIVGMWAVLVAARLRPLTRGLAMFAVMVSDVAILHGFFVWPKLIAAAFLLAAIAIAISPRWPQSRRDPRVAALLACLLALSLLAHGSSIFGVFTLALIVAFRGLPSWRWIGVLALVGAALLGSWSAYQRFDNPPGNRLLKWHLGGQIEAFDDRGTLEAIADGYSEAGFEGALDYKRDNFSEIAGVSRFDDNMVGAVDYVGEGHVEDAIESLRTYRFFSLLPFVGFFLIAPLAMLLARRRVDRENPEWRFAIFCFAFAAIGCVVWGLLQFGTPDSAATIHVGTLTIPLLIVCGAVAGLRATYPRLALGVVALNALLVLVMYVPSFTPDPGTSYSAIAAAIAAIGLAGVAAVLFRQSAKGA